MTFNVVSDASNFLVISYSTFRGYVTFNVVSDASASNFLGGYGNNKYSSVD